MGALRWHGEPCQGKKQVNEVKQSRSAVPGSGNLNTSRQP